MAPHITIPAQSWDGRVGAIILGGDFHGLGIARSLGRHGVPICVIDDERSIARFSRYTSLAVRVPTLRTEEETIDSLLETGHRYNLKGWVLFPTRDEIVAFVARNRPQLAQWFRVTTPEWSSIKWAWNKVNTYRLAEQLGIPIPQTWYPQNLEDIEAIDARFPLSLKPAIKENFIYATRAKAWRVDNPAELRARYKLASQFVPHDEIMIQDFIPGEGSCQYAYCSFFKNGKSVASLITRRWRQHPFDFGRASTYVESIELPLLEEYSERFLRAIDFYGLVEMEYKRDPRDGQYRLLDVNARTWGYHTIGRQAGVDFPFLIFTDQMNKPIEVGHGKAGVRWVRLLTDIPTGVVGILTGRLNGLEYLRTLFNYDEEAVFSREDPLPGLVEIALSPYLFVKRGF